MSEWAWWSSGIGMSEKTWLRVAPRLAEAMIALGGIDAGGSGPCWCASPQQHVHSDECAEARAAYGEYMTALSGRDGDDNQ